MSRMPFFSSKRPSGFTIVELIVVIVVIVILSLIVVALYDNLATNATDVTLKSDLDHAKDQLEHDKRQGGGSYPDTAAQVDGGAGFAVTGANTLTYTKKPYGYCVTASNPDASQTYVVRSLNNAIEEGTCDVSATLFAGTVSSYDGGTGYADGQGTAARFNAIEGMDIAKNGDIYVSDYNNYRIRKIDSNGNVTTIAGTGGTGCDSTVTAPALTSQIGRVLNVAYDSQIDTLYFMGCSGSRLLKVTNGTLTVQAGWGYTPATWCNGQGTAAGFYWSRGLTLGPGGSLYVGATELQRVCKVTRSGAASVVAGSGAAAYAEGTGTAAQFNWPWGVVVDGSGNIIVVDQRNCRIRKVTPSGVTSPYSGSGTCGTADGTSTTAQYSSSMKNMALDPTTGNIYLVDGGELRRIDPTGTVQTVSIPWPTGTYSSRYNPSALAFDAQGVLYVGTSGGIIKVLL